MKAKSLFQLAKSSGVVLANASHQTFKERVEPMQRSLEQLGLKPKDVFAATMADDPDGIKAIASRLRSELKKLRDGEAKAGEAPFRNRNAQSRLWIADVAQTMLEGLTDRPEDELLSLVRELLDLDRHRKALAGRPEVRMKFENAANLEAEAEIQGARYGVRALARQVRVSPSTITAWRKDPKYRHRINIHEGHMRFVEALKTSRVGERSKK